MPKEKKEVSMDVTIKVFYSDGSIEKKEIKDAQSFVGGAIEKDGTFASYIKGDFYIALATSKLLEIDFDTLVLENNHIENVKRKKKA